MTVRAFVLVGGWPGSGKTTLARALAAELGLPCLSKDEVKEALMDALGPDRRHLDDLRDEGELWGHEVEPLGVGPLIEVDTTAPVDVRRLAARIRDEVG